MRRLHWLAVPAVVILATAGVALAAAPSAGTYGGCPNSATSTHGHCEGEGTFAYRGGKLKPNPNTNTIIAPSNFACNQLNAVLSTNSIQVKNGAFDYTGKAKIGYPASPGDPFKNMTVRFKGSWKSAKLVTGYTRISGNTAHGMCNSGKIAWKIKTPWG